MLRNCVPTWYLASSISTYYTPKYRMMHRYARCAVSEIMGGSSFHLKIAQGLYTSTQEWKRMWPQLVQTLHAVMFFTDDDACIGAGVWQEICDALNLSLPVYLLCADGTFLRVHPFSRAVSFIGQGNYAQYKKVVVMREHVEV